MQIAYDQEMYLLQIKRIIQNKDFEKAFELLNNVSSIGIGSVVSISDEAQLNISK